MNRFCRCIRICAALTFLPLLLVSCNSMKKVPEDQCLLTANRAKVHGKGIVHKNDVLRAVVQEPNSRFFGFRTKLAFYNWSKDSVDNWWNNKLRQIGEKPAVFDSISIANSETRIRNMAAGKGYFSPELTSYVTHHGKDNRKVRVHYELTLDEPYFIRHIKLNVRDDSLKRELVRWEKETLLKEGMQYEVKVLDKERARMAEQMQNAGYWAFNKDYITYRVDSALGSHRMDVELIVRRVSSNIIDSVTGRPVMLNHKKYRIGEVYITPLSRSQVSDPDPYCDTVVFENITRHEKRRGKQGPKYYIVNQGKPIIKYKPVIQKNFMTEGDGYSAANVRYTYDNLSDLRVFQYNNISLTERGEETASGEGILDCHIRMLRGSKYGFSVEGQLTTSSGIQGIAATIAFQDRNTFGGGEIFSLKWRGAYELQATTNADRNKTFLNTFEAKVEASLEFPRFLLPISLDRFSQHFRPNTLISASYSYQLKRDYSRGIFNLTFGYHWKKDGLEHTLNPIEVGTVQMLKKSDYFQGILDGYRENRNYRLLYQYSDHFILTPRYRFDFTDQRQGEVHDFNQLRVEAEVAGSLLYGFFNIGGPRPEGGYKILGLPFSQYAKLEVDYRHHFVFGKKTELVFRALAGAGFSYGNSRSLPYEKSLFVGGNSTLRAWPLYELGPGSYALPDGMKNFERLNDMIIVLNLEQRFPIISGLRGAVFFDFGNGWLLRPNEAFPGGEFKFNRFYKEFALGTGVGLRYDFKFFVVRVDMGIPLRDPSVLGTGGSESDTWVIQHLKWKDLLFNFGIGYPF